VSTWHITLEGGQTLFVWDSAAEGPDAVREAVESVLCQTVVAVKKTGDEVPEMESDE
jgi:hypothetical protein